MRPREFPAESSTGPASGWDDARRFNEAAGVPRGIHTFVGLLVTAMAGFNEAAGVPRGILVPHGDDAAPATRFNEAAGVPRGIRASCQV